MRPHLLDSARVARLVVRAASLAVPRQERSDWTAEWLAEVWHLCHRRGPVEEATPCLVEFSTGAVQDAFWLRWERFKSGALPMLRRGSALRCALILGGCALASIVLCLCLPLARRTLFRMPYRGGGQLVLISTDSQAGTQTPSIQLSRYLQWRRNAGHILPELAYYRPDTLGVRFGGRHSVRMHVAVSSSNLFQVLGLPVAAGRGRARLVLSRSAWRRYFGSDAGGKGNQAEVDGVPVMIAGVLADGDWRLPGQVQAWLLEDDADLAALPAIARGFVVGQIRASAFHRPRSGVWTMQQATDGITSYFDCVSVEYLLREPPSLFLFALLLAVMALPATTALPLGSYPLRRDRLPRMVNPRRWAFLAMKFLLVLCIVYFASVDAVYGFRVMAAPAALYLEIGLAFPALLFGFRWILTDQRQRCPVCLRLLSNPARVGQASCNFLAWNGLELFCAGGHGLLYIPEMPTSWFSCQRWLCLDASWVSLFPEAAGPV